MSLTDITRGKEAMSDRRFIGSFVATAALLSICAFGAPAAAVAAESPSSAVGIESATGTLLKYYRTFKFQPHDPGAAATRCAGAGLRGQQEGRWSVYKCKRISNGDHQLWVGR